MVRPLAAFLLPILAAAVFTSRAGAQLPEYSVTMSGEDYSRLFSRDTFSNEYLDAKLSINGSAPYDVQIRFKGRSNRYFPKKSYRLRFSGKQVVNGAHQLNFHALYTDKSFLREKLAWDLFHDLHALAPEGHYALLTVNGNPKGLFLMVEKVDKHFLKAHGMVEGPIYETDDEYSLSDLTEQSDDLLKLYYPKEVGDKDDYSDLRSLIHAVNASPDSSFMRVVDSLFDMNSVLTWLAGNILTQMGDSYTKNYYLYRDVSRPRHQWTVIPWDYDMSFGLSGDPAVTYPGSLLNDGFSYTFPALSGPPNVLKDRLWNTPALQEDLRRTVAEDLRTTFTEAHLGKRIDSLAAVIRAAVAADTARQGTMQDFDDDVETLKYFVAARSAYLISNFVNPPSGEYNIATLPADSDGRPMNFVGYDGRLIATLRLTSQTGLDSILVEAFPDSLPPATPAADTARFVRRWLQMTCYPPTATFSGQLTWMYRDVSSVDREVGGAVHDERALRCFVMSSQGLKAVNARVNPFANTVIVNSVSQNDCGPDTFFVLRLP